eukprot:scaffold22379_cov145-Isochrysis_galbana.AAC.3
MTYHIIHPSPDTDTAHTATWKTRQRTPQEVAPARRGENKEKRRKRTLPRVPHSRQPPPLSQHHSR